MLVALGVEQLNKAPVAVLLVDEGFVVAGVCLIPFVQFSGYFIDLPVSPTPQLRRAFRSTRMQLSRKVS